MLSVLCVKLSKFKAISDILVSKLPTEAEVSQLRWLTPDPYRSGANLQRARDTPGGAGQYITCQVK